MMGQALPTCLSTNVTLVFNFSSERNCSRMKFVFAVEVFISLSGIHAQHSVTKFYEMS